MSIKADIKGPTGGTRSPGVGYLYILVIMFLAIAMGVYLSGGSIPVDPNGPAGPPTLEPYFDPADYGQQQIILPTGAQGSKNNLQLITFRVNVCVQKTAFLFLIDTSGSMKFENKMNRVKDALRAFTVPLAGKSAIGILTFSKSVDEKVPLSYYRDVRPQVQSAINGLVPDGWTVTRDGFNLAKQKLVEAKAANKFPGYKYVLIVMTDGVPEIPPDRPRTCEVPEVPDPNTAPAKRCFAKEQDPRVPTDLSSDIKNGLATEIYSIGIYSPNYPSDLALAPYLKKLLQDVSSQPPASHYYESVNAGNLTRIFESVTNRVCESQG